MRQKRSVLLAILLLTFLCNGVVAQMSQRDAQDIIRRGNERYARSEYKAAIIEYSQVHAEAGEIYAHALYNMGVCYYELWQTDDAIAFYRKAIEARKGNYPGASYALGVALEDQGRLAEAKKAYRQSIVASDGEYAAAHYRLGLLVVREGDYQSAANLFRETIARSPVPFPTSHNNLGVMLVLTGRLNEAAHEFEIAVEETNGKFVEAARNLKLCHSLLATPAHTQVARMKFIETIKVVETTDASPK